MSEQYIVGLVGPGRGPVIRLPKGSTALKITGMNGGKVSARQNRRVDVFSEDGVYELLVHEETVQFEYDGHSRELICSLLVRAHAVHSARSGNGASSSGDFCRESTSELRSLTAGSENRTHREDGQSN